MNINVKNNVNFLCLKVYMYISLKVRNFKLNLFILETQTNSADPVQTYRMGRLIRPRGYKPFFMLNSVEHEILNAYKYKSIKKFGCF